MYIPTATATNNPKGLGALTMDGTGLFGSGLFAEPFNVATWNWGEYAALGFGFFVLYSISSTAGRASATVGKAIRKRRR